MPGAAAITASASLLGSLLSNQGQKQANRANERLAALERWYDAYKTVNQNRFQKQMYDYTFNKENEYNSPVQQMQRYRDAGLNPYLMMQGQGAIGASSTPMSSSAGGGPSSIAMQNPFAQGADIFSSGISDAASAYIQSQQLYNAVNVGKSQINLNDANAEAIRAGIPGIKHDNRYKGAKATREEIAAENEEVTQAYMQGIVREDYSMKKLTNDMLKMQLPFIPYKEMMSLNKIIIEIQNFEQQIRIGRVTESQIIAETKRIMALTDELKLKNRLLNYSPEQVQTLINSQLLLNASTAFNESLKAQSGNPQSDIGKLVADLSYRLSGYRKKLNDNGFTPLPPNYHGYNPYNEYNSPWKQYHNPNF